MVNIKSTISFDEYNAIVDKVVNDCFPDGTYSPANYELSLRIALLIAFAPEYKLDDSDNNTLWESVTNKEVNEILMNIYQNPIYPYIEEAIKNAIDYRIKLIASGSMSMSDIALSNLFDVITKKIEQIDTSILTEENMNTVIKAVNATQDSNFTENLVDTMLDKGLLTKPNRETRRKNIKQTKKAESAEK